MIFREYFVSPGEHISETLPLFPTICVLVGPVPSFVTAYEWLNYFFMGYEFTAPSTFGDYSFSFTCQSIDAESVTLTDYQVIIHVEPALVAIGVDICCDEARQCNIAWYNREGGWTNWIFTGVRTVKVKMKKGTTFKRVDDDGDLTVHYSDRPEVYDALICTSGDITRTQLDYLDSMQEAIQAFAYNEAEDKFNIPVLIDSKSYTKYKTKDKFFEAKVSFIFATEIKIQSQ